MNGPPRDIRTVMVSRRRTSRGMASLNRSPVVTFETAARRRRNAKIVPARLPPISAASHERRGRCRGAEFL